MMKLIKVFSAVLLTVFTLALEANNDEYQQILEQSILSQAPDGISQGVWRQAVISQLSQCAQGDNEDCKCILTVAEGIQGDVKSATMWIGSFKDAQATTLWTGYASRFAVSHQNTSSVNMATDRCKRRNGVATVSGNEACIPGRRCRPVGVYRSLVEELGLPSDVALTSFYFSTPMQNEMYKFHDFYACNSPPCPATLGCLGLERHAMKALCLNYMGSNGSNGIDKEENGGVWLYFHNINSPGQKGDISQAAQGLRRMDQGGLCGNVSLSQLSDGALVNPVGNNGSYSGESDSYYESNNMNPVSSGMQVMQQMGGNYQQFQNEQGEEVAGLPAISPEHENFMKSVINACEETVREACPNVEGDVIREYCADQESFERGACEFHRLEGGAE